jgi:hypothetical protein
MDPRIRIPTKMSWIPNTGSPSHDFQCSGSTSAAAIRNYLANAHPDLQKHHFKMAVKRALHKQLIRQTKGVGFSGSFRLAPAGAAGKAPAKKGGGKTATKVVAPKGSLDDVLPLVFTWACNPKEASFGFIRCQHPSLHPPLFPAVDFRSFLHRQYRTLVVFNCSKSVR